MKQNSTSKSLLIFLVISIGLHFLIIYLIIGDWFGISSLWGGGYQSTKEDVYVIHLSDSKSETEKSDFKKKSDQQKPEKKSELSSQDNKQKIKNDSRKNSDLSTNSSLKSQNKKSLGEGFSDTPAGGVGDGVDASSQHNENILSQIRKRILKAKYYPDQARESGVEGVVQLQFEILQNGKVKFVLIVKTSGSELLDNEAKATIFRAQPYPFYDGKITMGLRYTIEE